GRVVEVSAEPGELFVEFETGDRIFGNSVSLENGIPVIEGEDEDRSIYGGEILVSQAAPRHDAMQASSLAVSSSPRPMPRPASIGSRGEAQIAKMVELVAQEDARPLVRPLKRPDHLSAAKAPADAVSDTAPAPQVTLTGSLAPSSSDRPQSKPSRL
ncbi:MAG: hypothetical protein WCY11_20565, partial [Novosphingobium sp.]